MSALGDLLREFASENQFLGRKGSLGVALVVTRHAQERGLPLDSDKLLTPKGGQVSGLSSGAVQRILADHGVSRVLAKEGGRTNRGNIGNMHAYVEFLNELYRSAPLDLLEVEKWWVDRVRDYFSSKPFQLRVDAANSLASLVSHLIEQARKRQSEQRNVTYVGTLLQHLVGAKLELASQRELRHHGASVADQSSGREGDFRIGDTAIHVTAAPTEAVIRKCEDNLRHGLRPVLVVPGKKSAAATELCEQQGIEDRADVLAVEQFLAANIIERAQFSHEGRLNLLKDIVSRYNSIVESCETDPSLRIEMK